MNTISTLKIRQELGDILNRVALRHDEFIVERKGRQLAAIVPVDKLLAMRKAAASRILKVMEENAKYAVDPTQADMIANEAKHKSRKRR
jgi:prevent-host-death family protein